MIINRNYKAYSHGVLIEIQSFYKEMLEVTRHYTWKDFPEKSEDEMKEFRLKEIARIKTELNSVWKEKIIQKLIPGRE